MNVPEMPQAKAHDEREDKPRDGVDPYLDWLGGEGIPVTEDYGVDLFAVDTAPWPRYGGVNGAAVHLKGRGDFANMFLFDIGPGRSTAPQLRMGRKKPVRDSAQRQVSPLQRQRHRTRASCQYHQSADDNECLPQ